MPFIHRILISACLPLFLLATSALAWRSTLYPEDWAPPADKVFNSDLFLQDFSHAGYRYAEAPLPRPEEPLYDVLAYGADPTGLQDSTGAIQSAIDACGAAGGGVVYLPEGVYRVAPPPGATAALEINQSNVILRGADRAGTRLLNTATAMRKKSILRVGNGAGSWLKAVDARIPLTGDLPGPTREIPVESTDGFGVGDEIVIHAEATPAWIREHQMATTAYWLDKGSSLGGVAFFREIVAIDPSESVLTVDTPVRYALKRRDNAAVFRTNKQLTGIGIEDISIGNIEHPGTSGWSESDFNDPSKSAYAVHASWMIQMENVRHGWIRNVHSFAHEENSLGTHMLSNGIRVLNSRNITLRDCDLQKVQYGGGGGNGYTYRFQNSQEVLVVDCAARYQRHGFVQSHMRNSGNVLHRVLSQETKQQTAGDGRTNGAGSDHHMHLSQSMLFDMATADRDFYDAHWRSTWGTVAHGLTSTNTVFWNTRGKQRHPARDHLVRSDQYGFGYVIGTSGASSIVDISVSTYRTEPADFVEGEGMGKTLQPASLYRDQLQKRTGLNIIDPEASVPSGLPTRYVGSTAEGLLSVIVDWGADNPDGRVVEWTQTAGPVAKIRDKTNPHSLVHLPEPGTYEFVCRIDNGWYASRLTVLLELAESGPSTYLDWAEESFGPEVVADAGKEASRWGFHADPDLDRFPNGIEFTIGTVPLKRSTSPFRWHGLETLAFECSPRAPLPRLEVSTDGSVWETVPIEQMRLDTVADGLMTVTVSMENTSLPRFLRLKAEN